METNERQYLKNRTQKVKPANTEMIQKNNHYILASVAINKNRRNDKEK